MATDIFLRIMSNKGPIKGESKDDAPGPNQHAGDIEVTDWTWSFTQVTTMQSGGGGGAGKVAVEGIEIGKNMDLSTPTLAIKCCSGEHLAKATLFQRKAAGDTPLEYLVVDMYNVIVESISHSSSGEIPTEKLKLRFAAFKLKYLEQDTKTGMGKPAMEVSYDLKGNKVNPTLPA